MILHIPKNAAPSTDPIADLLRSAKTIAIVGLSANPSRPSNGIAAYLLAHNYRVIPVNPNEREVLGQKSYARLEDVPEPIDIVNVFRRSELIPPIADSAIAIHAKSLWLQLGIANSPAAAKAHDAGLLVIENACILIEHKKRRPLTTGA
jgi:uncharacterized protein